MLDLAPIVLVVVEDPRARSGEKVMWQHFKGNMSSSRKIYHTCPPIPARYSGE
jgi:hypothetical protein